MKALKFNNEQFQAEKIIKTNTSIIGQDLNGNEIFTFKGVTDLSGFILEEGQTFDIEVKIEESITKEVANLKIDSMKKDTVIASALQTIANLKVEIMGLKGGNV